MKAITPVVGTILLLLIAVVMVGFSFGFFSGILQSTSNETETEIKSQTQKFGQSFKLDNVNKNEITIRNIGIVDLPSSDFTFFVDNTKVDFTSAPPTLQKRSVGAFVLSDAQLAMLPDPATRRGHDLDLQRLCQSWPAGAILPSMAAAL